MVKFDAFSFANAVQKKLENIVNPIVFVNIYDDVLSCTIGGIGVKLVKVEIKDIESKFLLDGYKLEKTCKTLINLYMEELTKQILKRGTVKATKFYK